LFNASAEKCFATLDLLIMVRAISRKDLVFLSTTPFYCGVLGEEKSWRIPCVSQQQQQQQKIKRFVS
jgi:hypothetical protein